MRHKAIIALTPGYNMEAAPPDLEPFLVTAGWRYDLEKRIKVYVTADGREIDRKALSQREIDTYKETHMAKSKYPEIQVGQVFGELTVIEELAERDKNRLRQYRCRCSCGELTVATAYALHAGMKRSCGHLRGEYWRQKKEAAAANGQRIPNVRNLAQKPRKAAPRRPVIQPVAEAEAAPVREAMAVLPEPEISALTVAQPQPIPPARPVSSFDLRAAAQQIEGITQLAKAIPLHSVAAVRDELRRLKEEPLSPLFNDRERLDEYLAVANEFYEYRSALEGL